MSKLLNHSLHHTVEFGPEVKHGATGAGSVKAKMYKKYNTNGVITEVIAFYILPRGTTLASFCKKVRNKP
jgi:hypothetical protein